MTAARLEYLFNRYVQYQCTVQEQEELMALIDLAGNDTALQILIGKVIENTAVELQMPEKAAASVLQNILQKDKGAELLVKEKTKDKSILFMPWLRVAAVAFLCLAGATYLVFNKKTGRHAVPVAEKQVKILPGGDRAILTLSDGSTVILDSLQNGTLQRGTTTVKKQGGLLTYRAPPLTNSNKPVGYNTLSTPRGGQYRVILPDGSRVWLNAASSLHFPTAFNGSNRQVELTGEAYFEVAKDKEKPFQVKTGDMEVNVLGTHFNIKAYSDEDAVKTSLLEGSVSITKGGASGVLKPGQQAILNKKGDEIKIAATDMSEVMAWKEGLFQFDGSDLNTIMSEISRWYDVDVIYADKVPVRRFEGKISRDTQLSEVLEILKLSNVKFTVVGKKIIVQ